MSQLFQYFALRSIPGRYIVTVQWARPGKDQQFIQYQISANPSLIRPLFVGAPSFELLVVDGTSYYSINIDDSVNSYAVVDISSCKGTF